MTGGPLRPSSPSSGRRRPLGSVTVERSIRADPERVWALWTTKDGLGRWWAHEDVVLAIDRLDPAPGGAVEFTYRYRPVAEDPSRQAAFDRAGVPTTYTARGRFTEFEPVHRLGFAQVVDFGPSHPPLELEVRMRLRTQGDAVTLRVNVRGTPTAHWKNLAETSLSQQVDRLLRAAERPRPAHL